jgi:hypothetical protein
MRAPDVHGVHDRAARPSPAARTVVWDTAVV